MRFVESMKLIGKGFDKWDHKRAEIGRILWRSFIPVPAQAGPTTSAFPGSCPWVVLSVTTDEDPTTSLCSLLAFRLNLRF